MFKVVLQITMRLHDFLSNNGADAGRFFCKRLRVWHRQARASRRSSFDSRGPFLCILVKLGRLLQIGLVGSCCCLAGRARACTAAKCPTRSRTRARRAPPCSKQLQPWRERRTPAGRLAARHRLPAASMLPPPRRAEPAAAELPWRPRPSLRCLPLPVPCTGSQPRCTSLWLRETEPQSNRTIVWASRAALAESPRVALTYATETNRNTNRNTNRKTNRNPLGRGGNPPGPAASVGEQVRSRPPAPSYADGGGPLPFD